MQSLIVLLSATALSYMLCALLLRFSRDFGVKSRQTQGVIRWASTSKPTVGGFAFYITFLLIAVAVTLWYHDTITATRSLALLLSSTLAFLVGFYDDTYGMSPRLKMAGQIACGGILLAFGIHIEFFNIYLLDAALTIFWVVGIMNSVNMLDNMDGVTTTIALTIVGTTLGMMTLTTGLDTLSLLYMGVAGGFMGFLFWNWSPARMYMGDTGSLFVGMVLAFAGIIFFWNTKADPDNVSLVRQGTVPILAFIVPIMDTTFVTVARIRRGVSPFQGGRDHLTHHLVHIGIPQAQVPVVLGMISIVSGGLAMVVFQLIPEWRILYTLLLLLYPLAIFGVFTLLYHYGGRLGKLKDINNQRRKMSEMRAEQEHRSPVE